MLLPGIAWASTIFAKQKPIRVQCRGGLGRSVCRAKKGQAHENNSFLERRKSAGEITIAEPRACQSARA
jgi:hypothetical protein